MPLTRDEVIEQYGIDPDEEGGIDKLNAAQGFAPAGGGVKDHLKSAAVGALSIPTDFINFIPTVADAVGAAGAAYRDDTKFVDEFAKRQQIPEAEANTQRHFQEIAQAWKQQNPALSDEDIIAGLNDYQKSKQYEDFKRQQLGGTAWLAATTKNAIRGALGDERPESERSWTEGAAEAVGGALVPGPTGWANATRAAVTGVPVIGRAANSLVGRGALRTAEIFTPLTMPYTGTNVAINAAAGVAMDQAGRGLQGQATAFTPTADDSNGIGSLAATGGVIAAMGAVVAAVRGRTSALQGAQLSDAAAALRQQNMQPLNAQIANPPVQGQAGMIAGEARQLDPPAYNTTVDPTTGEVTHNTPVTTAVRHLKTQLLDEGHSVTKAVEDVVTAETGDAGAGRLAARQTEQMINDNFNAVQSDRARGATESDMLDLSQALRSMPGGENGENARGFLAGAQATSQRANWAIRHDNLLATVRDAQRALQNAQTRGATPQVQGRRVAALNEARANFQRHAQDVPSARSTLPNVDQARQTHLSNQFLNDQRPWAVQGRAIVRRMADEARTQLYNSGRISRQTADEWRTRNPYFIPLIDDPLQGLTGMRRFWRSIVNVFKEPYTQQHSDTASVVGHEGMINSLDRTVRRGTAGGPETRIARPLDVQTSLRMYMKGVRIDAMLTHGRNNIMNYLTTDPVYGGPSAFVRAGHARLVRNGARTWFSGHEIQSDFVKNALRRDNTVPVWNEGRFQIWELGDKDFARMLRHQPNSMHGLMRFASEMSKWFKHFTTGFGNMAFAPKGASYNMFIGVLTKSADRSFGTLDTALRHILPAGVARQTLGRIIDPTVILTAPYHFLRTIADFQADNAMRWLSSRLSAESGPFAALAQAMGPRAYQDLLGRVARTAYRVHESHSMHLKDAGMTATHGMHQGVERASQAYDLMAAQIPASMRTMWSFYKDIINAIYLTPQRMFYTQNYGLLHRQYRGNIPRYEMDRLISETRHLGGNMTKVAGSTWMRNAEAMTPYLSQTKLGTYHLLSNMSSAETFHFVLPRLAMLMGAVGTSMWWRTTWNAESADAMWNRTNESRLWRYVSVPHPNLMKQGWDTPFSRDMFWELPLPPDLSALIAATGSLMQTMGALPSSVSPRPLSEGILPVFADSVTPGMPPAFQALFALGGLKLDPQTADTRGGSLVRSFNANFRSGSAAEAASNLGQATNTQTLMFNALWGAFGSHVAQGLDVMLHASKYDGSVGPGNVNRERNARDFGAGLHAAMNNTFANVKQQLPDVPLLWQGAEKYSVTTMPWKFVQENKNYIRNIQGEQQGALSKTNIARRERDVAIGGVPQQPVTDHTLLQLSNDVGEYAKPSGPIGQLQKQYNDYSKDARALRAQYNLSHEERQRRVNTVVKLQQDNMKQQQLAIEYLEQELAKKYGQALAPRLAGREFTLKTISQMMRANAGGSDQQPEQQQPAEQP